jgi:hypothetical protein
VVLDLGLAVGGTPAPASPWLASLHSDDFGVRLEASFDWSTVPREPAQAFEVLKVALQALAEIIKREQSSSARR